MQAQAELAAAGRTKSLLLKPSAVWPGLAALRWWGADTPAGTYSCLITEGGGAA